MNVNKIKSRLYQITSLVIFIGFLMMCQPYSVTLFTIGFPVLLFGTVCFIILDHIP